MLKSSYFAVINHKEILSIKTYVHINSNMFVIRVHNYFIFMYKHAFFRTSEYVPSVPEDITQMLFLFFILHKGSTTIISK